MERKIHIHIGRDNVIQYHRFCLVEVCITGKLFLSEPNAEFRFLVVVVLYTMRTTIFKQNVKWSCLLFCFNQLQKETTSSSNIKRSIGQGNFWSGMRVWLQRQCAQFLSEENPLSKYSQEHTILHACKWCNLWCTFSSLYPVTATVQRMEKNEKRTQCCDSDLLC